MWTECSGRFTTKREPKWCKYRKSWTMTYVQTYEMSTYIYHKYYYNISSSSTVLEIYLDVHLHSSYIHYTWMIWILLMFQMYCFSLNQQGGCGRRCSRVVKATGGVGGFQNKKSMAKHFGIWGVKIDWSSSRFISDFVFEGKKVTHSPRVFVSLPKCCTSLVHQPHHDVTADVDCRRNNDQFHLGEF